jgi:hypothetical protein
MNGRGSAALVRVDAKASAACLTRTGRSDFVRDVWSEPREAQCPLAMTTPFSPANSARSADAQAVGHCGATLQRLGTPRDDGETTEIRTTIRALLGSGFLNLNPALVTITLSPRDEATTEVTIRGVAEEGLIKQRAGQKAAERVAAAL